MLLLVLESVFFASFSVVALFYAFFFLVLCYCNRKKENDKGSSDFLYPNISMIVPVFNEGKIIQSKIENLLELDYPKSKLEVIFVDGNSTDNTPDIISSYAISHEFISLVRQRNRKGYNAAVFDGFRGSTGEIIVITQADALYEPDALKYLVRHFGDPKIGAVTGKQLIMNENEGLATEFESAYRRFYDFVRTAETRLDSPFDVKGEICAIRREICEHLLSSNPKLLTKACVDCCLSCQARLEGYRTVFEPKAKYYEHVTSTLKDRMKQQVRRGTILIESLLLYKKMLFNKKYGLFGLIVLPAHLFMLVILPWLFALGSISFLILFVTYPTNFLILLIIVLAGLLLKPKLFLSFMQSQIALVVASLRVAMARKSQMIEQLPSTRPQKLQR